MNTIDINYGMSTRITNTRPSWARNLPVNSFNGVFDRLGCRHGCVRRCFAGLGRVEIACCRQFSWPRTKANQELLPVLWHQGISEPSPDFHDYCIASDKGLNNNRSPGRVEKDKTAPCITLDRPLPKLTCTGRFAPQGFASLQIPPR